MKNAKKIIALSIVLACFLVVSGIGYAIAPTQQAKIIAEEELPRLFNLLEENYKEFNYSSQEDVAKSYLGEPIENYTIKEEVDTEKEMKDQMKQFPFYVFPVMVDGEYITDLTVVLKNEKWTVVDIGGSVSKMVNDTSKEKGLENAKLLRYNGQTYIVGKKGSQEVAYSPFHEDSSLGLEKQQLIDTKDFKKALKEHRKILKEKAKRNKGKDIQDIEVGGSGSLNIPDTSFKQEQPILRLARYIDHILK